MSQGFRTVSLSASTNEKLPVAGHVGCGASDSRAQASTRFGSAAMPLAAFRTLRPNMSEHI